MTAFFASMTACARGPSSALTPPEAARQSDNRSHHGLSWLGARGGRQSSPESVSHPLLLLSIGFIAPVDCVGLGLDGRAMVGGRQRTYSKSRSPPAVEKVNRKHQLQQVWARKANCVGKGLDTSGRHRQGW